MAPGGLLDLANDQTAGVDERCFAVDLLQRGALEDFHDFNPALPLSMVNRVRGTSATMAK